MNIIVALILAAQVAAKADDKTIVLLKEFAAKKDQLQNNDKAVKALDALSKSIPDDKLSALETFANSPEGNDLRMAFAKLLIDRKRIGSATHLIVLDLTDDKGDRRYHLWKWWEYGYGERKDYEDLTWKLTDALMTEFDKGSKDCKLAIAEVFSKGETESKMNLSDFKKSIDYEGKREKWKESQTSKQGAKK